MAAHRSLGVLCQAELYGIATEIHLKEILASYKTYVVGHFLNVTNKRKCVEIMQM